MINITKKDILECGLHFGHSKKNWNPAMKEYIFGEREDTLIIDIDHTISAFRKACALVEQLAYEGKTILFIGTKRQAKDTIKGNALRCNMPYVSEKWVGGLLTNFETIKKSILELNKLEEIENFANKNYKPRELAIFNRKLKQLKRKYGGIKHMENLPDIALIIDIKNENLAIKEASKFGCFTIGLVDTDSNPKDVDLCIPGNDDAIKGINLVVSKIADAFLLGKNKYVQEREITNEKKETSN